MYLKPNLNHNAIKRLVFFDIDQTLSSSTLHHLIPLDEALATKHAFEQQGYKHIHAIDTLSLEQTSVRLLSELFKIEGTFGVCTSAWVSSGHSSLEEIERLFATYAHFPNDWLIGATSGLGGDRYKQDIIPFQEKYNLHRPHVAIDDRTRDYSTNDVSVEVDGRIGFNVYQFVQACDILRIDTIEHNESLDFTLKTIREQCSPTPNQ